MMEYFIINLPFKDTKKIYNSYFMIKVFYLYN